MSHDLNPEQQLAATTLDRPVVVTAGAGSGKTRMLTERFINGVLPHGVEGWEPASVEEIVAITFTEKAAGELGERIRQALRAEGLVDAARRVDGAWISTIHGLCSRLLRRHAFDAGLDPEFRVADTVVSGRLRAEAFERAAVASIESESVESFFDAYSYGQVFAGVQGVVREAGVRGLTIREIDLEPAPPLGELLDQAVDLFGFGCTACDDYSGGAKSAGDHTEHCAELLGRALELREEGGETREALIALGVLVGQYRPLRRLKGLEDTADEIAVRCARLQGEVGAAITSPFAGALRDVAARYADEYASAKTAAGVLDFEDLQTRAVELLKRRPEIAARYRSRFRLVMIDEFQDTDALQLALVEALADNNLCTVGDEKQSIYRFRGADIDVYRRHRLEMHERSALEVSLHVNYRSHPQVLAFINAVFASAEYFDGKLLRLTPPDGQQPAKAIDSALGGSPRVEALFVNSSALGLAAGRRAEAREIARRLAGLRDGGVDPGDMAVLVRAYSSAHFYAEALAEQGVPAIIVGGARFFELEEVAIMRALTRTIANPAEGTAVGELLASEFCPVSDDGLARLRLLGEDSARRPLWDVLREGLSRLGEADAVAGLRLIEAIETARAGVGARPLSEVLLRAVEDVGYDLRLLSRGNIGRDAFANVLKFARQADEFEAGGGNGPAGFSANLDARERFRENEAPESLADDGSNAVRIMSVHGSKGLEFPVVVVPDLAARGGGDSSIVRTRVEQGRLEIAVSPPATDDGTKLPSSTRATEIADAQREAETDEGNRVLYVAFTRARDLLIVSGSTNLRPKTPSKAKDHLHRLARLLGIDVPVSGPVDTAVEISDTATGVSATCHVRVIDGAESLGTETADEDEPSSAQPATVPPRGSSAVAVPPQAIRPDRVSYTSLHTFEQCPRAYFVRYVLRLPNVDVAEAGSADPRRFGSALHAALQLVGANGAPPDAARLVALGRQFELGEDEIERLADGVARFVTSATARAAARAPRVARELAFALPVAGEACLLGGSIDLYARVGADALIVDYKSGRGSEASDAAQGYELQAACYALAALVDGCESVEVVFTFPEVAAADGEPDEIRFSYTASDEDAIRSRVDSICGRLATSEFDPRPARDEIICRQCPAPAGLCPHARRPR